MRCFFIVIPLLVAFAPFDSPKGIVAEGNTLFGKEKYDEALGSYDRALSLAKNKPAIEYNRANTLMKKGDMEGALKAYSEGIANGGSDVRAKSLYNMGNALYEAEKYGEAAGAFKEALKSDPADKDAKVNLEMALRRMEEEQKQDKGGGEKDDEKKKGGGGENKQKGKEGEDKEGNQGEDKKGEDEKGAEGEEKKPKPEDGEGKKEKKSGNEMTKEEAERLLENLGDRNMDLQNLTDMVQKANPVRVEKDW